MTQINILLAYLPLDYLPINILNKIEIYLLDNNLLFGILSILSLFSIYLFASRAGQRIIEGAISGVIAGALIETGKQNLNSTGNSSSNNNSGESDKSKNNKSNTNNNNNINNNTVKK